MDAPSATAVPRARGAKTPGKWACEARARAWEARYVVQGRLDALLREARRMYRLAGGEKFSAFAHGAVAWAA